MTRRLLPLLLLLARVLAEAEPCALDVAPASTLLVPYVSVEMSGDAPDPSGASTLLRVTNTAAEASLIQLTVWSADGVPALTLIEVLSGYDMWVVNFRDVLSGRWSQFDTSRSDTAPANTENSYFRRTPFEWGPDGRSCPNLCVREAPFLSPWPRSLATPQKTSVTPPEGCRMPYGDAAGLAVAPTLVETLRAPLRARSHAGCEDYWVSRHPADWLSTLGDDPLFFYATVDVVATCTGTNPTDPAYLTLTLADRNVLIGDVLYLGGAGGAIESMPAVHVQAEAAGNATPRVGLYEAVAGVDDRREPLPTAFAARYADETTATGRFPRSSALMLWKTSTELDGADWVLDCGNYMYYAWDEDEHVVTRTSVCPVTCNGPDIDPNLFPFRTQLVPLDALNFDLPGPSGWIYLVLPSSYAGFSVDPTPGDPPPAGMQGFAAVRHEVTLPGGVSSAWEPAAVMGNAHCESGPRNPAIPRRHLTGH